MAFEETVLTPKEVAEVFMNRVKTDKDACIGITGDEGDGKSTLAILLIIETLKLLKMSEEDIKTNLNNYIMYSPNKEELHDKVIGLPRLSTQVL